MNMGCWKCSCGHYVDTSYQRCIFCQRPKPGSIKQGDIEYTLTFLYTQKGKVKEDSVVVKGPVNVSTGEDHRRLTVSSIVSAGSSVEYLSFDWENSIPHGNPLQIWPVAEGGFEVTCLSPSFTANGVEIGSGKVWVETGSVLMLSFTMAIKAEDFRGPAFIEGSLSPVGAEPSDRLSESDLYMPQAGFRFYNGLNFMSATKYSNAGVTRVADMKGSDWEFVNKSILSMFGIKFKRYKDTVAALQEGSI